MKSSQLYLRFFTSIAPSLAPLLTAALLFRLFSDSSSGTFLALNQAATTVGVLQFGLQISITKMLKRSPNIENAAAGFHALCHRAVLVALVAYTLVCMPLLFIYHGSGMFFPGLVAVVCYLPAVALSPAVILHQALFLEFDREASNLKAVLVGVAAVLCVQVALLSLFRENPAACATAATSIVALVGFFIRRRSLEKSTSHVYRWREFVGTIRKSDIRSYGDTVTAAKNSAELYAVSTFFMLMIYAAALGGPQTAHWLGASVMIMRSVIKPLRQAGVVAGRQLGSVKAAKVKTFRLLFVLGLMSVGVVLSYALLLDLTRAMVVAVCVQAAIEVFSSTLFTISKILSKDPLWGVGAVMSFCAVAAATALVAYAVGRFTAPNVWLGVILGRCVVACYTLHAYKRLTRSFVSA